MAMVRNWGAEMEAIGVSTTHPLVAVRQLNLDDRVKVAAGMGAGRVYAKETRPSGRSRVPIRELSTEAEQVNQWMKTVREVKDEYYRALTFWLTLPDFEEMARCLHWSKTAALRNFDCGLAIVQAKMLDA